MLALGDCAPSTSSTHARNIPGSPLGVEAACGVRALEGVRAERVALRLDDVRRTSPAPHGVKVLQRRRVSTHGTRDLVPTCQNVDTSTCQKFNVSLHYFISFYEQLESELKKTLAVNGLVHGSIHAIHTLETSLRLRRSRLADAAAGRGSAAEEERENKNGSSSNQSRS